MKRITILAISILALTSCTTKTWEYKSVTLEGQNPSKFTISVISSPDSCLNAMAKQNWELVSTYTTVETVHPNFGNEDYVTGLQPNARTNSVVLIFKREVKE